MRTDEVSATALAKKDHEAARTVPNLSNILDMKQGERHEDMGDIFARNSPRFLHTLVTVVALGLDLTDAHYDERKRDERMRKLNVLGHILQVYVL